MNARTTDDVYRVRWREGLRTVAYLYRHPHDVAQIANVIEAFQGRSTQRLLAEIRRRPRGRALLIERPSLRAALTDHAYLATLPEGSLGREYLAYCEREGITTMTEYVEAGTHRDRTERLPSEESFIQDFLFHAHDLYHLVTGYRTDLLGEVCLLAFTAPQTRSTGVLVMALLGFYSLRLPRLRGQRLMISAAVRALRAEWLPEQDWVALLPEQLEDVRKRLGLHPAPSYTPLYVGKRRKKTRAAPSAEAIHVGL